MRTKRKNLSRRKFLGTAGKVSAAFEIYWKRISVLSYFVS